MTNDSLLKSAASILKKHGIVNARVEIRQYPDETIVVLEVPPGSAPNAAAVAAEIDSMLLMAGTKGFATVRATPGTTEDPSAPDNEDSLLQSAAAELLAQTIESRSRTSKIGPSLEYIPNGTYNVSAANSPRHHLVFGRRGAGKTALLLELEKRVVEQGGLVVWVNVQTYRSESPKRIFTAIAKELAVAATGRLQPQKHSSLLKTLAAIQQSTSVTPVELNEALKRLYDTLGHRVFVFVDDLHYLPKSSHAELLELIHGASREANCWMKVATIKHLSRWFNQKRQIGLQTGHDAATIDLDLTLQNPSEAKLFLERVLRSHAIAVGIPRLNGIFSAAALDRLVFAAGAVPRDYLMLSADTIRKARARRQARTVGVEDVNRAAGEAAQRKIAELEDDSASVGKGKSAVMVALERLTQFCVGDRQCTFFGVDFQDKENEHQGYALLQELLDLRLVHLVSGSVSDPHEAGRKAEVFTLDLSRYSGERLKKNLKMLDFVDGVMVQKTTGSKQKPQKGDTSLALLAILRRAPQLDLASLR